MQCLQTSELISHRIGLPSSSPSPAVSISGTSCSMNATWRQVSEPSAPVLSYDSAVNTKPSSGSRFHSLQATSHALQPMQTLVSVKKPTRSRAAPS